MKRSAGEIVIRYVCFYLAVVFFFSLYSSLLDLLFYRLDYGSEATYRFRFDLYVAYFGIGCLPLAASISILYNLALSSFRFGYPLIRILIGVGVGLFIGLIVKTRGYSFYIGEMRPMKNVILFPLIGVSIEVIRLIKDKMTRKNLGNK